MTLPTQCPHCSGRELYTRTIVSAGGNGPFLLQGLGALFRNARFDAVLCSTCGHYTLFAEKAARKKVRAAKSWHRVG